MCYFDGNGVEKNLQEAAKWFKKSAEQGYPLAQYNLGLCYAAESGFENDSAKSYAWIMLSAKGGCKQAQEYLAKSAEKNLTKEDLKKAHELAKKYERGDFD